MTTFLEDFQGRTAFLFKNLGSAGSGLRWEGVSPLLHPTQTLFWVPKDVIITGSTALVTLANPPEYGLCPVVSSVIYEGIESKVIAQACLNRDAKYAEILYGQNKIKACYNEPYVQLELFQLPVKLIENDFWDIAEEKAEKIVKQLEQGEPLDKVSQLRSNILKDFID